MRRVNDDPHGLLHLQFLDTGDEATTAITGDFAKASGVLGQTRMGIMLGEIAAEHLTIEQNDSPSDLLQ